MKKITFENFELYSLFILGLMYPEGPYPTEHS